MEVKSFLYVLFVFNSWNQKCFYKILTLISTMASRWPVGGYEKNSILPLLERNLGQNWKEGTERSNFNHLI